jgi:hypothetical protein
MKGKAGGVTLAVIGAVLIIAAAILKFVVVPGQAQFPDDVDTTRYYSGTLSMLNPAAIATGDLANLFLQDVPITIDRTVTTEEVDGGSALVKDEAFIKAPTGDVLIGGADLYTIDRKTMEPVANFTDNPSVIDAQGLVIGWPIGSEKEDYQGWNGDVKETVTAAFVAEVERHDRTVYEYHASSAPKVIVDEATLANFPPSFSKQLLGQIGPSLGLPAELLAQLPAMLDQIPGDDVPLQYTYGFDKTYWIDPTTGVLIDIDVSEQRYVGVPGSPVPLASVYDLKYTPTQQSIDDAIKDADDNGGLLKLLGTTVPFAAGGVGIVMLLAGLGLAIRKQN